MRFCLTKGSSCSETKASTIQSNKNRSYGPNDKICCQLSAISCPLPPTVQSEPDKHWPEAKNANTCMCIHTTCPRSIDKYTYLHHHHWLDHSHIHHDDSFWPTSHWPAQQPVNYRYGFEQCNETHSTILCFPFGRVDDTW